MSVCNAANKITYLLISCFNGSLNIDNMQWLISFVIFNYLIFIATSLYLKTILFIVFTSQSAESASFYLRTRGPGAPLFTI